MDLRETSSKERGPWKEESPLDAPFVSFGEGRWVDTEASNEEMADERRVRPS